MAKKMVQNGIQELKWVDPTTLSDNPLNWKIHPESQMQSVMASIQKNGWVKPLIYNTVTGRLIDGHGRKAKAVKEGLPLVPVLMGSWDEDSERHVLQTLDPLGAMFRTDPEKLASLNALVDQRRSFLNKASAESKDVLERLQRRMERLPQAIEAGKVDPVPLPLSKFRIETPEAVETEEFVSDETFAESHEEVSPVQETLAEDILFPSKNPWNLPDWDTTMFAEPDLELEMTYAGSPETITDKTYYCHSSRSEKMLEQRADLGVTGGVYGFFCEDWRFEGAYDNVAAFATWVRDWDWTAVLQPDFSVYGNWPFPMNLWNLYRSRWVARYWQSLGIRVIPVLQTLYTPRSSEIEAFIDAEGVAMPDPNEGYVDIGLVTIPVGCPVIATECRTIKQNGGIFKDFAKSLTHRIEYLQPKTVIIYGGEEHQSKFRGYLPGESNELRYIMLRSYMAERRGWIEKKSRKKKRG